MASASANPGAEPNMAVDHVGTSPQKRRVGDVAPAEGGQPLTLDLIREAIRGEIKSAVGGFRDDVQAVVAGVDNVESQVTTKMQQTINLLEDMTGKYHYQQDVLKQLQEANREVQARLERLEKGGGASSIAGGSTAPPSEQGRQPALIIGGWDPEQEAHETKEAVEDILKSMQAPISTGGLFVPGIRRGYAILPIPENPGETAESRRSRIQEVISKVRGANVILGERRDGGTRKVWIAMSQPPERRRRSRMAAKVKRLYLSLGGGKRAPGSRIQQRQCLAEDGEHHDARLLYYRLKDPHTTIATLAKAITIPGKEQRKFRESTHLHRLRAQARTAPVGAPARQAWKAVSRQHKQERRAWQKGLAEQAANLDWKALRALQQGKTHRGWQLQLTDDPQWQHTLTTHMKGIFAKVQPVGGARLETLRASLRRRCKHVPWEPFTAQELAATSHKWARNKSTGPDGVSHEAARTLLEDVAWGERIREMLSDMLYVGKIPSGIEEGITVLLPKIPSPLEWGEIRPITLSSTFLKWAAQLLLARAGTVSGNTALQNWWGGSRHNGFQCHRGGDNIHAILQTRSLNVAVGDVVTPIPQTNGIRQGSPDSPDLFGGIIAEDLSRAIQRTPPQPADPRKWPPPPSCGGSFLDDTYLWSQHKPHLQQLLTHLEDELQQDGLSIHPVKTAILYSQAEGGGDFTIQGGRVPCQPHGTIISALGSPITFGDQTTAIVGEMARRARAAFAKHKRVLKARTSIRPRLVAYDTLVRNAALYAAESWLWGHLARGGEQVAAMLEWKNLRYWRIQQQLPPRQRVKHAGRFNPGGDIERALESIAGTRWGEVAQDRGRWQALQQALSTVLTYHGPAAASTHYKTYTPTRNNTHQLTHLPPSQPEPRDGCNAAADSLALAVSHQIQLIHDTAGSMQGDTSATITTYCDVAAQLLALMYPTGIVPDTCKRGRPRGVCNSNYLVDALSSFTHHLHGGGGRLTREEWQQDLSYLIRVLEEGAVQLHEPMPAAVSLQQLQWGARCLQRAIMLLTAALDSSLRAECCWNTPKLWGELRDLTAPAATLLEQRGEEPAEDPPPKRARAGDHAAPVHPADVLQLAQGGEEGGRRTTTAMSAASLLFDAAAQFRKLVPTLVDEQVPLALQLLRATEATQQAMFGGSMAADEETQTDDGGPLPEQPALPAQGGKPEQGDLPAKPAEAHGPDVERPTNDEEGTNFARGNPQP
ncbi:unnamed protein product, partial [Symbiodinium necroappetens]